MAGEFSIEAYRAEAMANRMDMNEFRMALKMKSVRMVMIRGGGQDFHVEATLVSAPPGGHAMRLVTTRGKAARLFRNPEAALLLLKAIGAELVSLDLRNWHPLKIKRSIRARPDMAARLKLAHQAAKAELKVGSTAGDSGPESEMWMKRQPRKKRVADVLAEMDKNSNLGKTGTGTMISC